MNKTDVDLTKSNNDIENEWINEFDQNNNINNTVNLINNSLKFIEATTNDKNVINQYVESNKE